MPPEEIQTIEDFLTFIENASTTFPATDRLWEHLRDFLRQLETVEDNPLKIALSIQTWCQKFNINIDPATMRQLRVNMLKKGQKIPKPAPGEQAIKVYNKASIAESVHNANPPKPSA